MRFSRLVAVLALSLTLPMMSLPASAAAWVGCGCMGRCLSHPVRDEPVRLVADANGVTYHGSVAGFGAGTGAAFALLNYAFDEVGNPALRPMRRRRASRVTRVS